MRQARTWMFVPGSDRNKLEKVDRLQADAVIYDLEDAVAFGEKDIARQLVHEVLQAGRAAGSPARYVRVNAMDTPYFEEDIRSTWGIGLGGIVLPKAEDPKAIARLDAILAGQQHTSPVEIVPLIETARGLYQAYEIARASKRIKRLMFGSIDFALDIQAQLTPDGGELLYARSQLVVVSRAAGIEAPIDAVFPNIRDTAGLIRETQRAKQLGFRGKLLIHPCQIGPVREVFAPSSEEVLEAEQIVSAFQEALSAGIGSIQVRGKMVDTPVYERAKRVLEEVSRLIQSKEKSDERK
ncbi:HpcH/HpaI aldolase/citrate lyase family protein [Brevibacillus choshinensis]|uniref:CoA ester lyase n=1 Tax=Brevibacillus choshinensis TaxID=54911 RepID=A0ABX7FS19_BRECH|nr:CoA ester lyase [Brevibacillus choshinensis]QRG69034.1 CoA ester lyase [Brevibacillus choshinensis]